MLKGPFTSILSITVLAAFCCNITGCDTPTGQGAGIGAVTGAAIGGLATNRAGGAALGAATGALAGALIGSAVEEDRAREYGPRGPQGGRDYPEAVETDSPGYVYSPYEPHHKIDVRGIPEGALVRDPSCNRLFINP